jgi:hypothetical protein
MSSIHYVELAKYMLELAENSRYAIERYSGMRDFAARPRTVPGVQKAKKMRCPITGRLSGHLWGGAAKRLPQSSDNANPSHLPGL